MVCCELYYMTAKTLSGPHSFFLRNYQMLLICSLVVVAVSLIYYYSFFFQPNDALPYWHRHLYVPHTQIDSEKLLNNNSTH